MSHRKRALRATTMRVLADALLGGVAASCIYAAFFGSRSLDVAWLWLQAVGMRRL